MAKRRNLKKEKALRNQAYARQFRSATSRSRNPRFSGNGRRGEGEEGGASSSSDTNS